MTLRVLCFSGSAKQTSLNQRLVAAAAQMITASGAQATLLNLRDHEMPLFNEDLEAEQGDAPGALSFRTALEDHDVWLIASPEYNGSITPLLKNAIDWASRQREGKPMLSAFRGKLCALLAASPGGLGGLRGLVHVRAILEGVGVFVIPQQLALPAAHTVLDAEGNWLDEGAETRVRNVVDALLDTAGKLTAK
ncbi:MAG: FMN reductase [Planctomycetota bacterium]|nr:MAG: FMN reductase [Planctomycetota bacterium]